MHFVKVHILLTNDKPIDNYTYLIFITHKKNRRYCFKSYHAKSLDLLLITNSFILRGDVNLASNRVFCFRAPAQFFVNEI